MPTQEKDREAAPDPVSRLAKLGRRLLGTEAEEAEVPAVERRACRRHPLELPIDACLEGGPFQEGKTLNLSLQGLALELAEEGVPGQRVSVRFRGSEVRLPMFTLQGRVVRVLAESATRMGVTLLPTETPKEALQSYRRLMLHHLYQT